MALVLICAQSATAQIAFEDVSANLPEHVYQGDWEHFVGGGVAVLDCNGDARPDLFAAGGTAPARLFVNQGGMRFADVSVPRLTGVTGAYPLDIDGDGWLDLFVLRVGANVVLQGGPDCRFKDVTTAWDIPVRDDWSTAFTAWWPSGFDRPVMAVGNYVDRHDPEGPFGTCDSHDLLFPGPDGWRAETLGPGFCTLSMLAARDASGTLRLRISNDRHYYIREGFEQMYDPVEQRFLTEADGWPRVSLWGMGIASRDITGDGRDEVMLTSMGDQLMQIAQADGSYVAAPFSIGSYAQRPFTGGDGRPSTGWHAEFGDMDNDGRADLFIAKGNVDQMPGMAMLDPNNLLMQQPDGTFAEAADTAGLASMARSRGAALADFDGDGLLDVVVINRRAPMELYRNVTPDAGGWLAVDIRAAGNTRLVGGMVRVTTPAGVQTQQIVVGGGHAGGQAGPLHFGLGQAGTARVEVIGPDGAILHDAEHAAGAVMRLELR
ncbi:CRTAC1 family protein [Thalassococcus arenae]|uniref:CRTAC1 family protein n=1 Tax=Thalassococcus arenae TaxID=2851652 RepID=UPI0020CB3228|nr:CRTAC1 family protein [Thalassococcus arenae]